MKDKLVSIIIPTFNRATLVVEAIKSVKAQTYPSIQLIVVDDGSEDNTAQLVAQFEEVEYYRQENKGQASARNLGLKYAKGEYIATLDSDDIWFSEFLSDSIKCIEKHNLDFVFLNWISMDGKENFLCSWEQNRSFQNFNLKCYADWFLLGAQELRRIYLEGSPSPSSSLLIRRSSIISTWNNDVMLADDWLLILEMVLRKPCCAAFTLKPYWLKRVFDDNIYDGRDLLERTMCGLFDEQLMVECLASQLTNAEKALIRKRLARLYLNYGRLKWKGEGISKSVFYGITSAFAQAPVGLSLYIMKRFMFNIKNYLKARLSTS